MSFEIRPLSPGKRLFFQSYQFIGEMTCIVCGQVDVKVLNDEGPGGNPAFNYMEDHFPPERQELCVMSGKTLNSI